MSWQVEYALANFAKPGRSTAELVDDELIRVMTVGQPDVLAVISAADVIDLATATYYRERFPPLDFLCGYRSSCIWWGGAIQYLVENGVGWGSFGTLSSAVVNGKAKIASHKTYSFADRLLRQYGRVAEVVREYDRIYQVTLKSGMVFRLGMIAEYEPTADAVRSLWDRFGPMDIAWNINPNGSPSKEAIEAGNELGCRVVKWEDLREFINQC